MLDSLSRPPSPAQAAVVLAVLLSLALVWRLDRPRGRWGRRLRSRFVLGVPWGTLISVVGVLAVYLFAQQGLARWRAPLTVPFSSWSYLYPTGWLLAAFSHAGPGHLVGNLTTTLAVAPLAEYAFGHFPPARGENPFASWRSNPWVRAFVVFPLAVFGVGVATSAFSWGPVIGFSGVVFAFVGFALVRYPLLTVVAVTGQAVVVTVYRALRDPTVTGSASSSFTDPWWYGVAVQGHALGLLIGAALAVAVLSRRPDSERPSALRLWTGAVVLGIGMNLWAVWWYRGESTYVLYRALGVAFVVALAAVVAAAVAADRRPLVGDISRRQVAVLGLLVPLAVMAGVAVPVNLTSVDGAGVPGDGPGVETGGYTVTYAENVPNEKVSVVDVSVAGETTNVTTSGVIVVSDDREIWTRQVSKGELAHSGGARVRVGGLGWSEVVDVQRVGWSVVDGPTAYQVWLRGPNDGNWTSTYTSDAAEAGPTLAGRNVTVVPRDGGFAVELSRNNSTVAAAPMPRDGESVELDGIRFEREGRGLFASFDGTELRIAARESYN